MSYRLALLMIPMPMTLLFIAGGALLLVLIVHHGLMDNLTLLLVNSPAPLLTACVKHSAAACLRELIAMLLVTNTLGKIIKIYTCK